MNRQRILMVGLGNLGSYIFDALVRTPGNHTFLVGGRHVEKLRLRTNVSLFSAMQLGYTPEVTCAYVDLLNIEQTAEMLSHFRPDIIVCAATLQPNESINAFPAPVASQLAAAQLGPRLPLHLALIYKLMQAVKMSGITVKVLNAIYPDVVGPILKTVGLAPTTGIGDLANNVPALRHALAYYLKMSVEHVDVRLVMARYVSYKMSRSGIEGAPFHFSALVDGSEATYPLEVEEILHFLRTTLKRQGGTIGLLMTAASAVSVFHGLVNNTEILTHAPGPDGLPGGYPIKVNAQGIDVVLPPHMSLERVLQINEDGLRLDGIQKIERDGTVYFAEENMATFKRLLGYECKQMPLKEVDNWAEELHAKFLAFARKYEKSLS